MNKLKIVYINNEAEELGGTSLSLANLLDSLSEEIDPIIILRAKGSVYDFFVSKGYRCIVVPFRFNYIRGNGFFRNLTYCLRVFKNKLLQHRSVKAIKVALEGEKIDIIHTNSSVVNVGFYLAKQLNIPHVWHIREFIDNGLHISPIGGMSAWKKRVFKSNAVVAISKALFTHLGMEGRDNCYLISDAVEKASNACYFPNKDKYFVFLAGRVHAIKYPNVAVEVFCKSELAKQGYKLKIVGRCTDQMKGELLRLAGKYGFVYGLEFVDFTPNVKPLLSKASGFILSSKFEGLGRVLIEAMFYGCPVLAFACGPSVDLIQDGENGFLFTDINSGAHKLTLFTSKDCTQIIQNAQNMVKAEFSQENYGEKIMDIYRKLV